MLRAGFTVLSAGVCVCVGGCLLAATVCIQACVCVPLHVLCVCVQCFEACPNRRGTAGGLFP